VSTTVFLVLGVAGVAVVLLLVVGFVALVASRGEQLELDEGDEVFGPAAGAAEGRGSGGARPT
jgi:hypothetical protein